MMQWPVDQYFQENFQENLDRDGVYLLNMDSFVGEDHNFPSSITTPEDSSVISSDSYLSPMFSDEFMNFQALTDEILPMEGLETTAIDDVYKWFDESEEIENQDSWSPSLSIKSSEASEEFQSMNSSLVLPDEDMEIDSQTGLCHILKAYGEAMEMGERELAGVIVGCINEKVSPVGETLERVAFNLFQSSGNQNDYIKQESRKNFEAAFKAFYEIFPYGRFAHFAANSIIIEAIPNDVETVHVVDFDMGEGVQWPPMIEAIGRLRKTLKLTSIKLEQSCSFEETKMRLLTYARAFGVNLKVEEITMGELKNIQGEGEWVAFNCMNGLPHMGRRRSQSHVSEFLSLAKPVLATNKGIITFGDGEDGERMKNCGGYGSFFEAYLMHYRSIYESMESNFPTYLTEARIAMESLFVAPYVSSLSWFEKWEEERGEFGFQKELGLEAGWRVSIESAMEAKEMVKERESSYRIKIAGEKENEMVLEWRGTPLVRVSAWK